MSTSGFVVLQEVTLSRGSTNEKVGLTLCYGSADDEVTDIFVQEVRKLRFSIGSIGMLGLLLVSNNKGSKTSVKTAFKRESHTRAHHSRVAVTSPYQAVFCGD